MARHPGAAVLASPLHSFASVLHQAVLTLPSCATFPAAASFRHCLLVLLLIWVVGQPLHVLALPFLPTHQELRVSSNATDVSTSHEYGNLGNCTSGWSTFANDSSFFLLLTQRPVVFLPDLPVGPEHPAGWAAWSSWDYPDLGASQRAPAAGMQQRRPSAVPALRLLQLIAQSAVLLSHVQVGYMALLPFLLSGSLALLWFSERARTRRPSRTWMQIALLVSVLCEVQLLLGFAGQTLEQAAAASPLPPAPLLQHDDPWTFEPNLQPQPNLAASSFLAPAGSDTEPPDGGCILNASEADSAANAFGWNASLWPWIASGLRDYFDPPTKWQPLTSEVAAPMLDVQIYFERLRRCEFDQPSLHSSACLEAAFDLRATEFSLRMSGLHQLSLVRTSLPLDFMPLAWGRPVFQRRSHRLSHAYLQRPQSLYALTQDMLHWPTMEYSTVIRCGLLQDCQEEDQ